jgi:hypothetical protein
MHQATREFPVAVAPSRPVGTWWLFALCALGTVLLTWYTNEFVMTRDVYHQLLGGQMESSRIDTNFDLVQRMTHWGYLATPFAVLIRVGVVTLILQLFLLLMMEEFSLGELFRITTLAYPAVLYGSVMRTAFLAFSDPASLSAESLGVIPGSLASLTTTLASSHYAIYLLLGQVSVSELLWCVIVVVRLTASGRLSRGRSIGVVAAAWTLITLLQWGLSAYTSGVRS